MPCLMGMISPCIHGGMMRRLLVITVSCLMLLQGCATIKNFFGKGSIMDPDDPNFLNNIQKLRSAYQDGKVQALDE